MQPTSSTPIKAVIFDIGGVLMRTEDLRPRTLLADGFQMTARELEDFVFNSETGFAAQRGEMSAAEFWAGVARQLEIPIPELSAFRDMFFAGDVLDPEMMSFVRALRPRFKTAVITNALDDIRDGLIRRFNFNRDFDHVVVSAEEGMMKPDPRIFQKALTLCGVEAHESIFIDDLLENVRGARDLGMQGIWFRDRDETLHSLKAALKIT